MIASPGLTPGVRQNSAYSLLGEHNKKSLMKVRDFFISFAYGVVATFFASGEGVTFLLEEK